MNAKYLILLGLLIGCQENKVAKKPEPYTPTQKYGVVYFKVPDLMSPELQGVTTFDFNKTRMINGTQELPTTVDLFHDDGTLTHLDRADDFDALFNPRCLWRRYGWTYFEENRGYEFIVLDEYHSLEARFYIDLEDDLLEIIDQGLITAEELYEKPNYVCRDDDYNYTVNISGNLVQVRDGETAMIDSGVVYRVRE